MFLVKFSYNVALCRITLIQKHLLLKMGKIIRPRWRKVVVPLRNMTCTRDCSYSFFTPDDGCDRRPKHVE